VKATIVVGPTGDTLGATEKIARMSSSIGETINFAASRLMGPGRCLLEPRLVVMVWWGHVLDARQCCLEGQGGELAGRRVKFLRKHVVRPHRRVG